MRTVILVQFVEGYSEKPYAYYANDEDNWVVGDFAVVETSSPGISGYEYKIVCVTKVKGLTEHQIHKASKWIVQKIDREAYDKRMEKEAMAQEIINRLEVKRKSMERFAIYNTLASQDDEVKVLLAKYAELTADPKAGDKLLADKAKDAGKED